MTIEDIALSMTPGLGDRGVVHLLELFSDARQIFSASEAELIGRAELRADVARQIVAKAGFSVAERELKYCERNGIHVIASTDEGYPSLLREIPDYPHILYVKGDVRVLTGRCVAMVGTRGCTTYGVRMSCELVAGLAERVPALCIVSGLALGIDAACHRAALAAGVATVAVLPSALPDVVPSQHAGLAQDIIDKGGALVTEVHSQAKQRGEFYIPRNRIIAGMSAGTVIVESSCSGGALHTGNFADGYGRSLMAVPGRVGDRASQGTNMLIRNRKAQLVTSARDVIDELAWELDMPRDSRPTDAPGLRFTQDEAHVMACFPTTDPVSFDRIGQLSGMEVGMLSNHLLQLEMQGALRKLPGNSYIRLI